MTTNNNIIPVGIDVGSLHARVAVSQQEPKIVSNTLGHRSTLACVVQEQHDDSHVVFGLAAKKLAAKLNQKQNIMMHDCLLYPNQQDVCQAFMLQMARLASDATSTKLTELRITLSVPTDASDTFIESLVQATTLGIKRQTKKKKHCNVVVGVMTDAAAVCVAHGLADKVQSEESILVIDWGASGLTITSLENCGSSNIFKITSTSRHEDLSGQVFTQAFGKHVASQFERKNRLSSNLVWENKRARNKLLDECEAALKTMNSGNSSSVHVTIDGLYEGIDCHVGVSRPRWDMLTSCLFTKANAVLQDASKQNPQVVLLAGSVGLMPSAQQLVNKIFTGVYRGLPDVPPDEAVALGCARHAAHAVEIMQDRKVSLGKPILSNVVVSPIALGLVRGNDSSATVTLIGRGTPLPAHVVHTFSSESGETWSLWQLTPTNKLVAKIEDLPGSGEEVELLVELSTTGSLALAVQGGELVHVES